MGLYYCSGNKVQPSGHQHYLLGHNRDIEFYSDAAYCMDAQSGKLELHSCHHRQGSQYFRYDVDSQQIKSTVHENKCLEAVDNVNQVHINPCDEKNVNQKWTWGKINSENLANWKTVGAKIL